MRIARLILMGLMPILLSGCFSHEVKDLIRQSDHPDAFRAGYDISFGEAMRAAAAGDADGQYALGYMYYYGIDTAQDTEIGRLWIHRAAEQGQPLAIKAESLFKNAAKLAHETAPSNVNEQYVNPLAKRLTTKPPIKVNLSPNGHLKRHPRHLYYDAASAKQSSKPRNAGFHDATLANQSSKRHKVKPRNAALANQSPKFSAKAKREARPSGSALKGKITFTQAMKLPKSTTAFVADDGDGWVKPDFEQAPMKPKPPFTKQQKAKAIESVNKAVNAYSPAEKNLMLQPEKSYTLQLFGTYEKQQAEQFIAAHHLQKTAVYYHTHFQGKDWYVVIKGIYPTLYTALAAASQLPAAVQTLKPWAKPIASVQAGIAG